MRTHHKRTIVVSILLLLALWPPIHRLLVVGCDFNPWKWYGWSMYCTQFRDRIRVDTFPPVALTGDPRGLRATLRLHRDCRALGAFFTPDRFASDVFQFYPQVQQIDVLTQRAYLDRETGRLQNRPVREFTYRRQPPDFLGSSSPDRRIK